MIISLTILLCQVCFPSTQTRAVFACPALRPSVFRFSPLPSTRRTVRPHIYRSLETRYARTSLCLALDKVRACAIRSCVGKESIPGNFNNSFAQSSLPDAPLIFSGRYWRALDLHLDGAVNEELTYIPQNRELQQASSEHGRHETTFTR